MRTGKSGNESTRSVILQMTAEECAPSVREQDAHRDHSAWVELFRRLLRSNFSARPGWSTGTARCRFYLESVDAILFRALLQVRYLHHLVAQLGGRKRLLSLKGVVFTRWLGEVWVKKSIFEEHKKLFGDDEWRPSQTRSVQWIQTTSLYDFSNW